MFCVFFLFWSNLGWKDWNNMIVMGGSVTNCLLHIPDKYSRSQDAISEYYNEIAYADSDIDVFIYGLDEKQYREKLVSQKIK